MNIESAFFVVRAVWRAWAAAVAAASAAAAAAAEAAFLARPAALRDRGGGAALVPTSEAPSAAAARAGAGTRRALDRCTAAARGRALGVGDGLSADMVAADMVAVVERA
jgi:hypothetical protein